MKCWCLTENLILKNAWSGKANRSHSSVMAGLSDCCYKMLMKLKEQNLLIANDIDGIIGIGLEASDTSTQETIDETKCMAKIKNKDGKCVQCSRSKKQGNYCVTHYNHAAKGQLRYGEYSSSQRALCRTNKHRSRQTCKRELELEFIIIDNIDYLIDPITRRVYDFDNMVLVGKIKDSGAFVPQHSQK